VVKTLLIALLLALVSVWGMAESNGGDHKRDSLFRWADTDKNGSVSSEEHQLAIQEMVDKRRQRFIAMDTNGDGSVTKDEAREMRKKMHGRFKEKIDK